MTHDDDAAHMARGGGVRLPPHLDEPVPPPEPLGGLGVLQHAEGDHRSARGRDDSLDLVENAAARARSPCSGIEQEEPEPPFALTWIVADEIEHSDELAVRGDDAD